MFAKIKLRSLSSVRSLIKLFKNGSSIALMIDQRVSEGFIQSFGKSLHNNNTCTICKKFKCKIVQFILKDFTIIILI